MSQKAHVSSAAASKKAVFAALIGTLVEWFEFGIYGYFALTLSRVFFPAADPLAAILSTWGVFAVAFVFRPLGAVVAGRYADRYGRKPVLAVTVLGMGVFTFAIGLIPGYATIGIAAPLLLVLARLGQGLCAGGEFGGAVAFVVEHGDRRRAGFVASIISASVFVGLVVGSLLAATITSVLSPEQLTGWGWRIPFLLAAPISLIGLYIRMKLEDTPEFKHVVSAGKVEKSPVQEALRTQWKSILVFIGFAIPHAIASYLLFTYLVQSLVTRGGYTQGQTLLTNALATAVVIVGCPIGGLLTDRFGRKPMLLAGSVVFGLAALPAIMLASQPGSLFLAFLAQALASVAICFLSPPMVVSVAEMFPARVRVTAGGLAYNLTFSVFGATTPIIATVLVSSTGSRLAPGWMAVGFAVLAFVVTVMFYKQPREGLDDTPARTELDETPTPTRA